MNLNTEQCPICKSKNLWNQSTQITVSIDGNQVIVTLSCLDCNKVIKEFHNIKYDHTEVS